MKLVEEIKLEMKGITKLMQENEMKIQERDSHINQLKMELDGKSHEISGLQKGWKTKKVLSIKLSQIMKEQLVSVIERSMN